MAPMIILIAVLGLLIGSFLNVVIYRVPAHQSLSHPGSHCPNCDHPIRYRHNIPLFGWLMLRGRCADCKTPISVRYPLIELTTAVLFVAVALRIADLDQLAALPGLLYFTAMGITLAMIDLDSGRLPNAIVYPSYPVLAVLLAGAALIEGDPAALLRAAIGAASLFAIYFALIFTWPDYMGFGDVKLAGIIGGVLGFVSYSVLIVGAFAAFVMAAAIGVTKLLRRNASRKTAIAFGPFMIAGALLSLFVGSAVSDFYLRLAFGT